jgi:hypothetical protein
VAISRLQCFGRNDLHVNGDDCGRSHSLAAASEASDKYFRERLLKIVQRTALSTSGGGDAGTPFFRSRKGGAAITTRTAERQLSLAWSSNSRPTRPTSFREAHRLGLLISRLQGERSAHVTRNRSKIEQRFFDQTSVINDHVASIEWLLRILFPSNVAARDDARQHVLLCYLTRKAPVTDLARYMMAVTRFYHVSEQRRISREQSGVLDDWSFIAEGNEGSGTIGYFPTQLKNERNQLPTVNLMDLLNTLTNRERLVVSMRFGLDLSSGQFELRRSSRRAIASLVRCTEHEIRALEAGAIDKLRLAATNS